MFAITNHRADVRWQPSPNIGGRMEAQLIVIHETAGRLDAGSAADWLCNPRSGVSAHFTIERSGEVVQHVACDVVAWHAGKSSWDGRQNCNGFSIGIELVGPGALVKMGSSGKAWFGGTWPLAECEQCTSPPHGGTGYWLAFTPEQLAACRGLVAALLKAYPRITDVRGHFEISPGRKVDPNPTFDMDAMRALCAGRTPLDPGVVLTAQRLLHGLAYDPGDADKIAGPKFRSAVFAFQGQNGLKQTGELDGLTLARLAAPDAVPMTTGTKVATTKADVQGADTAAIKRTVEVGAVAEFAQAGASLQDALGKAAKAKTSGDQLQQILAWLISPAGIRSAVALGVCVIIWMAANKIDWARVRARIRGLTAKGV